jgi:hypothetical protein
MVIMSKSLLAEVLACTCACTCACACTWSWNHSFLFHSALSYFYIATIAPLEALVIQRPPFEDKDRYIWCRPSGLMPVWLYRNNQLDFADPVQFLVLTKAASINWPRKNAPHAKPVMPKQPNNKQWLNPTQSSTTTTSRYFVIHNLLCVGSFYHM